MNTARPPALPGGIDPGTRAVRRCVRLATVSAWVMLGLGGLSVVFNLTNPLSAGMAISLAVVVNGWIERGLARRLGALDPAAPGRLALNQLALGCEVVAYALWQAHALGPDAIERVLQRPLVATVLDTIEPEVLQPLLEMLPSAVRILYWTVGAGAFVGCAATAWYYASRRRWLREATVARAAS